MKKRVDILSEIEIFKKFIFRVVEGRLRFERHNGGMSDEVVRLMLDRGDSVAAVLHDPANDTIVLAEQFRYPTYAKGPGWVMELPAGMHDAGEDPEESMRREIAEEVGYEVTSVEPISTFYVSPGGTSERILLYYARVAPSDKVSSGGGKPDEGEDIRTVRIPVSKAIELARDGDIVDAKTLIGLQWLALKRRSRS